MTFKELDIAPAILRAMKEKGYVNPTPIQEKAIPVALAKRDIMGCAQTGTGKTASFAIPIIQLLQAAKNQELHVKNTNRFHAESTQNIQSENPRGSQSETQRRIQSKSARGIQTGSQRNIQALILAPTRELALQISECIRDYSQYTNIKQGVIFGGVKQHAQNEMLRRGIDILVATPGRLLDLMNQGYVKLNDVRFLVLDEADRMLDMGFIHDIKRIMQHVPDQRQTLLFSATMPASILSLANSLLTKPVRVNVTPVISSAEMIEQFLYYVEKKEKGDLLISLLREAEDQSVLVFSRTKHNANKIARKLSSAGIKSEALHGNKSQTSRQTALSNFKSGKTRVIVATDIASRGIDISELPLVINYDLPDVPETYVHRIGRTGRAGHTGTAVTFCSQEERKLVPGIQKLTGCKLNAVALPA